MRHFNSSFNSPFFNPFKPVVSAALKTATRVSACAHPQNNLQKYDYVKAHAEKSTWLYWMSSFLTMSALLLNQTLPGEDEYVRTRFKAHAYEGVSEFLYWSFILGGTGFCGAISSRDYFFQKISDFVERYMEKHYHTEFQENLTAAGKRRVYFRGETEKEAKKVLENNRSPLLISLNTGEFGFPAVKDATLHPTEDLPSGYTRSVISLTSDLDTTVSFGRGEAVLVVVPTKQRVAAVSQHAVAVENDLKQSGSEYEYICGGVHRNDILGVAYREHREGVGYVFSRFELNEAFTGDIEKLELDKQMEPLIALLPDHEPSKARLLKCVDPTVRYQSHYESLLSANAKEHEKKVFERRDRLSSASQRFFADTGEFYHGATMCAIKKTFGHRL